MNIKVLILSLVFVPMANGAVYPQVGIGTNTPQTSAALEVHSTSQGFLLPRLTSPQIYHIQVPAPGLLVFNSDSLDLWIYTGQKWYSVMDDQEKMDPSQWSCDNGMGILYEGKIYSTVLIGSICWLGMNLDVGTMINGALGQADNGQIEKYCHGNSPDSCLVYGGLYSWDEMMQYATGPGAQGICPEGWHIPTDQDWKILEGSVDSYYGVGDPEWDGTSWRGLDAGGRLKETGTKHWKTENVGATDLFGFTALPAGYRYLDGSFPNLTEDALFWTSSQHDATFAHARLLKFYTAEVSRWHDYTKAYGLSVRCMKD